MLRCAGVGWSRAACRAVPAAGCTAGPGVQIVTSAFVHQKIHWYYVPYCPMRFSSCQLYEEQRPVCSGVFPTSVSAVTSVSAGDIALLRSRPSSHHDNSAQPSHF